MFRLQSFFGTAFLLHYTYRVTELQCYSVTRGVTRVTVVTVTDVISLFTIRPTSKRCIHLLSPKRWSPNVPQPTLRSESRGCLHTLPSREEEKPPLWWIKKWRKNRAVTIFGVIRENFLKRMQSHFYFVKRSPFFNANFLVCPFSEKLPAAFDSHLRCDKRCGVRQPLRTAKVCGSRAACRRRVKK